MNVPPNVAAILRNDPPPLMARPPEGCRRDAIRALSLIERAADIFAALVLTICAAVLALHFFHTPAHGFPTKPMPIATTTGD